MDKLSKDWITEHSIDFEYKKYMLLAYLQHVEGCYKLNRLYPPLADLIEHYRTAKTLKESKQHLNGSFPQRMAGFDAERFRLTYEKVVNDDALMQELESILDFSLPRIAEYVKEGQAIFDFVEKEMSIQPVGILPLDSACGYLFLQGGRRDTRVYEYSITIFDQPDARYRAIRTSYVNSYARSITNTYEFIKTELIRNKRELPNPAVFAVETGLELPVEETFLPIAKRMLLRQVDEGKAN